MTINNQKIGLFFLRMTKVDINEELKIAIQADDIKKLKFYLMNQKIRWKNEFLKSNFWSINTIRFKNGIKQWQIFYGYLLNMTLI